MLRAGADALIAVDDRRSATPRPPRGAGRCPSRPSPRSSRSTAALEPPPELDTAPSAFTAPLPRAPSALADLEPVATASPTSWATPRRLLPRVARRAVERQEPEERESIVGRIVDGVVRHVVTARPVLRSLQRVPLGASVRGRLVATRRTSGAPPPDGPSPGRPSTARRCRGSSPSTTPASWPGAASAPTPCGLLPYDGRASARSRRQGARARRPAAARPTGSSPRATAAPQPLGRERVAPLDDPDGAPSASLVVVSPDEMYATGPLGSVYEGEPPRHSRRTPPKGRPSASPAGAARPGWATRPAGCCASPATAWSPPRRRSSVQPHAGRRALDDGGDAFAETRDLEDRAAHRRLALGSPCATTALLALTR